MRALQKGFFVCLALWLFSLSPTLWAQPQPHWNILVDESAALNIAQVSRLDHRFQELSEPALNYPTSKQAIWLKVHVSAASTPRWLWIYAPRTQFLDYYLVRDGQIYERVSTGEALPANTRPSRSRAYLFSLPSDQQSYDAYLRLNSHHPLMSWFKLVDEQGLFALERSSLPVGMLLGGLIVLALYSIIISLYTHSSMSLWLAGLYGFLALSATANLGFFAFWLPNLTRYQALVADLSAVLCCLCSCGYVLAFIRQHWQGMAERRVLQALMLLLALTLLSFFILPALWGMYIVFAAVSLSHLCLGLVTLRLWRRGYRPARLLGIGYMFFLASFVVAAPLILGYQRLQPGWLILAMFTCASVTGLFLATSIGERRRYETALQLSSQTQAAADQAHRQAKANFLSRLSHDIRTPMNGVLGMTELLLGTQLSAKQRDYARTINSSGNELLNLINQILDIAKLDSGSLELDHVPTDLNALIDDCVESFRARAERHHIELITFVQPQVPRIIKCDPARLRQAISRLLQSAFKQTQDGEILLAVALETSTPQAMLRIAIQNSEQQLSPEQKDALENEIAPSPMHSPSAQLDLFSARQLANIMGGEVGLQIGKTSGLTVWLTLPLPASTHVAQTLNPQQHLQGVRLLVVDDNTTCRQVLVEQCQSWGMSAHSVSSGKEALALLRTKAAIGEYFDAVLFDQDMPGLSGLALASKIKSDAQLNHDIALIMLTGLSSTPNRLGAQNAGVSCVLTKPVAGYTLKATLYETLSRGQVLAPSEHNFCAPDDFSVLVAEDNSISTKVILGMLGKLNIVPDVVTNGLEALNAMQQKRYALVLMDCEMPLLDGFSATDQLRQWERLNNRKRTPIVALTAHILPEHRARAQSVGMDDYLGKPIELSQLRKLVHYWAHIPT